LAEWAAVFFFFFFLFGAKFRQIENNKKNYTGIFCQNILFFNDYFANFRKKVKFNVSPTFGH
jgi:hypothetical protein